MCQCATSAGQLLNTHIPCQLGKNRRRKKGSISFEGMSVIGMGRKMRFGQCKDRSHLKSLQTNLSCHCAALEEICWNPLVSVEKILAPILHLLGEALWCQHPCRRIPFHHEAQAPDHKSTLPRPHVIKVPRRQERSQVQAWCRNTNGPRRRSRTLLRTSRARFSKYRHHRATTGFVPNKLGVLTSTTLARALEVWL